ncbi:MAG TPA: PAS domain S-box protein [Cyclobacteriaceae bacterium]|nr:PAS domain S-box protein [Cyclobacteriaceae bacterium]
MVKNWLKSYGLAIAGYVLGIALVANSALVYYLSVVHRTSEDERHKVERAEQYLRTLQSEAVHADFLAREAMLWNDHGTIDRYESAVAGLENAFDSLTYNLRKTGFDEALTGRMERAVGDVLKTHRNFLDFFLTPDSLAVRPNLSTLASAFDAVHRDFGILDAYINGSTTRASLENAFTSALVLQIVLLACVPLALVLPGRMRRMRRRLVNLNRSIDESNRKYVFDSLEEANLEDEEAIRTRLLDNLRQAATFIQEVAKKNYEVRWEGMNDTNREANRENIAGELIRMRELMKQVKEEDEIRMWMTEGLSKFGAIIQKNQNDMQSLGDAFISEVVKYLDARIGGLFIIEDEEEEPYLELKACYAYERKKFITHKVGIGEGLVGQTFLERQTVHLREVPPGYLTITSTLGESEPRSIVLIPLIANEKIEGILELASLNEYKPHHIEFLEKLGESLAASLISVRSSERMRTLLQNTQQQAEEVRAQEEEMRQNMEELEATQEQMHRQVNELNQLRHELEVEKYLFSALMDNIPESIYFKDRESKFIRVSKYLATHFGKQPDDLIGKSDFDFQDEVHAREALEDEQNIMRTRTPKVDYVEREVLKDGSEFYVSTTKMPLTDAHDAVVGTFGISRDVTALKQTELELRKKESILSEMQEKSQARIRELEERLAEAEKKLKAKKDK